MATYIILLIIILYAIFCIKKYFKTVNQGCCGGGESVIREIPEIDPSLYPIKETYKVIGMHCENCAAKIERKINQSHIYQGIIDLKNNTLTIYSKEPIIFDDIDQQVKDMGYSLSH